jgi:hypothetical protein
MPKSGDYNQSKYLRKEDCDPDVLVTIKGYKVENMAWTGEPEKMKWVLSFKEDVLPFVLSNKINQSTINQIAGTDDLSKWIGLEIVLYVNPDVEHKGERVGGIRVRAPKPLPGNQSTGESSMPKQPSIEEQRRRLAEAEEAERAKRQAEVEDDPPF